MSDLTREKIAELRHLSAEFSDWSRGENKLVRDAATSLAWLIDLAAASAEAARVSPALRLPAQAEVEEAERWALRLDAAAHSLRSLNRVRVAYDIDGAATFIRRLSSLPLAVGELQPRVAEWMAACFGPEISADRIERNHRFIEESLELVQACGCTKSEAHQLVDYVYDRPLGDIDQEAGGVMVTLAALCLANGFDMHQAGEIELVRAWTKIDKIRAKQAAKPRHSPLPEAVSAGEPDGMETTASVRADLAGMMTWYVPSASEHQICKAALAEITHLLARETKAREEEREACAQFADAEGSALERASYPAGTLSSNFHDVMKWRKIAAAIRSKP